MTLQELLRLQAKHAEKMEEASKQQRLLQVVQVIEGKKAIDDADEEVKELAQIQQSIDAGVSINKELSEKIKNLSETVGAANDDQIRDRQKQANKELTEKLVDLKTALEKNIVATLKAAGGGAMGKAALDKDNVKNENGGLFSPFTKNKGGMAGRLKSTLFGQQSDNEIQAQSGFGITGWMGKKLSRRAEEHAYVNDALKHDWANAKNKGETGGVANLANLDRGMAIKKAKKDFAKIKDAEDNLKSKQAGIDEATASGFGPTKKAVKERDAAAIASAKMDPRIRRSFVEGAGTEGHTVKEEAAEKAAASDSKKIAQSDSLIAAESQIGGTLQKSLEVQQKMLDALLSGAGGGGEGGGILDTASNLLGKGGRAGGGMLSKAAGFIGKNAGKLGAIGGVAMGAYDAYSGWSDASDAEARGEITHDEANVKKGEAVGGGVGGAGGAWAGAATGAAIGSVVPVVGTAIGGLIGGALGYWGGSKLGSAVGGHLTSAAQTYGAGEMPEVDPMGNATGQGMISATENNENLKAKANGGNNTTVVNAPTTINNGGGNSGVSAADVKSPIRNQESSMNRYINSRFA